MDKDAIPDDAGSCVDQATSIYTLYGATDNLQIFTPDDYHRFAPEMRDRTYAWLRDRVMENRP